MDIEYKRMFHPHEGITAEGDALSREISAATEGIINKYMEAGYDSHDLEHIVVNEIAIMVVSARLLRQSKLRRQNRAYCVDSK